MGTDAAEAGIRISDAATRAGVSARTLRYYEELGLLTPSLYTAGGERRYTTDDLAHLQRILELREVLGMNLDEIREFLALETRLDTGNPTRDLTPAEQAYMQSLIDNMFGQFIQAVADGRGMKFDDVKAIANGKVWTGKEALSMKLIDDVGDFQAVVKDTAKSVGISGEPTLVHPEKDRKTLLDLLMGDVSQYLPDATKMMEQHVGFYYLWK